MKIKELMTRDVATCAPDDSLAEPARIMWERDCGFVPVMNQARQLVGVITDRDVCMAAYTQGKSLSQIPVTAAMATKVYTCREDDDVPAVHATMRRYQVHRVPVVDRAGRLAGVVSLSDVARKIAKAPNAATKADIADTLAEICRPRALAAV
jgi:CBS domain-containing protein